MIVVVVAVISIVGEMVTNDVCLIPRIDLSQALKKKAKQKPKTNQTHLLPLGSPFVLNQCDLARHIIGKRDVGGFLNLHSGKALSLLICKPLLRELRFSECLGVWAV